MVVVPRTRNRHRAWCSVPGERSRMRFVISNFVQWKWQYLKLAEGQSCLAGWYHYGWDAELLGFRLWVKLENTLSVLLVELVIVWAFEMLDWFGKLVFSCSADHPVYFFLDLFCLLTYFDIAGVAENINWLWSRGHVSGCRCVLLLGSLFCCSQPMINHHFRTWSLRFDMCVVAF